MTKQAKGRIRIIAVIFLLLGLGLLGANHARAAITDFGQVVPVYDGLDPWNIDGTIWVGDDEYGELTVDSGSSVFSRDGLLGYDAGVTGTATITGPGSSWANSEHLVVGLAGIGNLTIAEAGQVSSYYGVVASDETAEADVTVTGLGSTWTIDDELIVAYRGVGTLTIEDGGTVSSYYGILADEAGSTGAATVTGPGSAWTIDDYLLVGHEGQAALSIENGGLVEAYDVYVGNLAGSDGTVYVTDPGSELSATETVFVGYDGQGEVQVTNGGRVSSLFGAIGYDIGSDGTVIVSDLGSVWDNEGSLGVGVFGDGTLTITNGATVESLESGVGVGPDSVATVEVSNGGTWTNTDAMAIGIMGDGTLTITSGGQVTGTDAYLGGLDIERPHVDMSPFLGDDPLDGTGTVEVTGIDSRWDLSGDLYVGYSGIGELEVSGAGVVTSDSGMLGFEAEGDGTATVTGAGSQWQMDDALSVGGAGVGTLLISNFGEVTADEVQIGGYGPVEGYETIYDYLDPDAVLPEGEGTVTVTGGGRLESDGLSIGFWGNGELNVDSAEVTSGWAELGLGRNAEGTAHINDATWTIENELFVGVYGDGELTIAGGSQVSAYEVYIGGMPFEFFLDDEDTYEYDPDLLPNGSGTVRVTEGSRLDVAGADSLYVGYFGDGTLDVTSGGQVDAGMVVVGAGPDAQGSVSVEDAGSLLSAEEMLLGVWGRADLTVANGGQVAAGEVFVGGADVSDAPLDPDMLADFGDALGIGEVTVTGSGSRLDIDDFLYVGFSGEGSLEIDAGGAVTSDYGVVGADVGSTGTVSVADLNSEWRVSQALMVGAFGEGDLTISAGGYVTAPDLYIGGFDPDIVGGELEGVPQGIGTVTVTGNGSLLDIWADTTLYVGYTGDGTLDVLDGGYLVSQNSYVGYEEGSTGTVTVSDPDSLWTVAGDLYVGYRGEGALEIAPGGEVVTSQGAFLGHTESGQGTVTVTGPDSRWEVWGQLNVGYEGYGEMLVSNGGQVDSGGGMVGTGYIGRHVGSTGSVTVTGEGSEWIEQGNLYIGDEGQGSLTISAGGVVAAESAAVVGRYADGRGEVLVTGDDSLWEIAHSLTVGFEGEGELTVADGGQVLSGSGVPDTGYIGRFAGSTGSVTVTGEGSEWIEESSLYIGQEGQGELTISDGGYVESNVGFIGFAEGSEGLVTVTGDDSLWRVFHSIYVGGSSTQAAGTGVLAVNDGGRAITDELTIWETGTLTGDGTVSAMVPATVHNYGTIAPGDDGIGTLTVQGSVVFHEGSTFDVQIGGTEADKLAVTGSVTIDEGSTVQVRSAGTVVGTQQYEIIEAGSVDGEFDVLDTTLLSFYFNEIGLDYESDSVWLWIDAMRFDDPMLLRTYNQRQVAGGLQRIADEEQGNAITEQLQNLDVTHDEMRDHYDQLGGRSRPSLAPIAVTGTTRFLGTISNRLRNPSAVIASGNGYGLPLAGASGPDGTVDSRISYDVDMGGYNFAVGNGSPYLSESRWGFWAKGYGLFGKRDHSIEAPGYEYRTYGVGVGLDYQFTETLLIGLTGGYADTYVNYRRSRDDSDLRAMHFGVYGSVDTGRTYLDSLLTYTDLDYDTERYVDLTSERLEGEFGGYAVSGYLETGFDWQRIEGWLVQPLASFQWSYLALESYRESGGDAALGFKRQSFESYIGSLGAKVSKDLLRDSPTKRLAVQFRARWLHEFGDTRADVNTYFASDPTVIFNIRNESIARDSAVLGVGLGAELNRNTRLYVDYDTRLNRDDTAHLISGGLQHRW